MGRKGSKLQINGKRAAAAAVVFLGFLPAILFSAHGWTGSESKLCAPLALKADLRTAAIASTPVAGGPELIVLEEDPAQRVARLLKEASRYYNSGAYEKSAVWAQQVLQVEPDNTEALKLKVRAQNARDSEEATASSLLAQATGLFLHGQYDGAALLYLRYMELYPESRSAILPLLLKSYYNLGVIALRQGRCDLAADYFRQNLFLSGEHSASRQALEKSEECAKAIEAGQPHFDFPELIR